MDLGFLNRRVSTKVGILIILLVAFFSAWLIIKEYKKLMDMRFEEINVLIKSE